MTRVAILDDYQDVARRLADWDEPAGRGGRVPGPPVGRIPGRRPAGRLRRGGGDARAHPVPAHAVRAAAAPPAAGDHGDAERVDRSPRRGRPRRRGLGHGRPPLPDRRADVGAHPRAGPARAAGGPGDPGRPLAGDARRRPSPGKTLGVLGLGQLGSRVARVGKAFEMDVDRLEPEPHRGARRRGRRDPGRRAATSCSPAPTSSRSTWC